MDVTSKYGEVLMPFTLQMQLIDHFPHYKLLNIDNIHIDCQADSVVVYSFLFLLLCICLQMAKTAHLKNPCISDSNTAKLVVINHLLLCPGCKCLVRPFSNLSDTDLSDISGNKRQCFPIRETINNNWTETA